MPEKLTAWERAAEESRKALAAEQAEREAMAQPNQDEEAAAVAEAIGRAVADRTGGLTRQQMWQIMQRFRD